MQCDSDHRMPAISPEYVEKDAFVQSELVVSPQTDGISWQQVSKRRQRPSSTLWHLILVLGDILLLITIFGLLLYLHLVPQLTISPLGIREVELIWICLALVSWYIAVNITQSQNLNYASNRFKGPCCTLFGLILMSVFWMPLAHFLLDLSYMTLLRLEVCFLGLAVPSFTIWRFMFAEITHLPRFRLRAVILGVNAAGAMLAKELQGAKHSSISVLGYIDDDAEEGAPLGKLSVLGGRSTLRHLVYKNRIDLIIIALEHSTNPGLFKVATDAAQLGVTVLPMAVVYESSTGKIPVEHVGDQWYMALQQEQILSPLYLGWKKALDLVCGICGLLILCLLTPLIALCIYLDSPGPIFYSQERVGLRGKIFRIYKFRTMRPDAEREGQAVWAARADARITHVGRLLRASHLDELPQLFNILRGDMSLIGPRPERAGFIRELEKTVPFYGYRLTVKPGLTGWAQVKYRYGRTSNDALVKLQYDLYYIKKQSFMLDLFIIVKTVAEVLSLGGA